MAFDKYFINHCSSIDCRLSTGMNFENKWIWWSVPGESRIYKQNKDNWSYYCQAFRRFYLDNETATCPPDFNLLITVPPVATSLCIEGPGSVFNLLPATNALSESENDYARSNLQEGFDYTIIDSTILLDKFVLPKDMCQFLVGKISNSTASIVSDSSFNPASPIGPVGTSAVILAPLTECHPNRGEKDGIGSLVQQHHSRPIAVHWLVL